MFACASSSNSTLINGQPHKVGFSIRERTRSFTSVDEDDSDSVSVSSADDDQDDSENDALVMTVTPSSLWDIRGEHAQTPVLERMDLERKRGDKEDRNDDDHDDDDHDDDDVSIVLFPDSEESFTLMSGEERQSLVKFCPVLVTEVHWRPRTEEVDKEDLFFTPDDYARMLYESTVEQELELLREDNIKRRERTESEYADHDWNHGQQQRENDDENTDLPDFDKFEW